MAEIFTDYLQSSVEDGALTVPRAEIEAERQFREDQERKPVTGRDNNPELADEARQEIADFFDSTRGYN